MTFSYFLLSFLYFSIFTQGDSVLSTGSEWELATSNSQAAADDDSLAANDSLATNYSSAAIERLADSYNLAASDSLAVELSSASHASETHSSCLSQVSGCMYSTAGYCSFYMSVVSYHNSKCLYCCSS